MRRIGLISGFLLFLLCIQPSMAVAAEPACRLPVSHVDVGFEPAAGKVGDTITVSGTWCDTLTYISGVGFGLILNFNGNEQLFPVDITDGSFKTSVPIPNDFRPGEYYLDITGCCPSSRYYLVTVTGDSFQISEMQWYERLGLPQHPDDDGVVINVQEDVYSPGLDAYAAGAESAGYTGTPAVTSLPHTGAEMSWHHVMAGVASVSLVIAYRAARSRRS